MTSAPALTTSMIAVARLVESPLNPRKFFSPEGLSQLAMSMKAVGFHQHCPCLVRPIAGNYFEIAAGHRRTRAAKLAGIEEIPCIVREMSDRDFLDVLTFDNIGRQAVHPLEEAEGWRVWMRETCGNVLGVAARIGQSEGYVYQRLKYADLIEPVKAVFLSGKITAGHAILIARCLARGGGPRLMGYDVNSHRELINRAANWLRYSPDGDHRIVLAEIGSSIGERPDVIGWRRGISTIIECKVSRNDFRSDSNKPHRLYDWIGVGTFRWYFVPEGLISSAECPDGWGLLYLTRNSNIEVIKNPKAKEIHAGKEIILLNSALLKIQRKIGRTAYDLALNQPECIDVGD